MAKLSLRKAVQEVQEVGKQHGFAVVIVGGAMVRLIGKQTHIQSIDTRKRTIILRHAQNSGVRREEDQKTLVDIDAIAFSTNPHPFSQKTHDRFKVLQKSLKKLQKSHEDFPDISIEPVFYHPPFPKPNTITQFVSSIEADETHSHQFYFRLGQCLQRVQKESLSIWSITFAETPHEHILSLMPLAIQRRYAIRGFAKKPKDKTKIWGEQSSFAYFVKEFQEKTEYHYEKYFTEWDLFEEKIQSSSHPLMQLKRGLWNTYWATIGTYLAHGTGFFGKLLLPLGNTLFAGK